MIIIGIGAADVLRYLRRLTAFPLAILLMLAGSPAVSTADWLYDGTPLSIRGAAIGYGLDTDMVAQPISFPRPVEVTEIGVAIAQGQDPNQVGFRITLAEDPWNLSTTTLASWNVRPVQGPILAFAYFPITPMALQASRFYYIVFAPGDSEFLGGVANAYRGYPGLATNDDGQSWFQTDPFGVRIGGSVVPEPAGVPIFASGCLLLCTSLRIRRRAVD